MKASWWATREWYGRDRLAVPDGRKPVWIGRIKPSSAALRSMPLRDAQKPTLGILSDLPRDARLTVIGQERGWFHVRTTLQGNAREGYVSRELVEYVSPAPVVATNQSNQVLAASKRRLFFAIYYRVSDHAFKRAAETWERETRHSFGFDETKDLFLSIEVGSESEFKMAWSRIHTESKGKFATVIQGQVFSHASKMGNSEQNGLEFKKDTSEDGTVMWREIEGLAPLNWDRTQGHLILSGCNSGLAGKRSWTPAEIFARAQKVRTTGQSGYAYFSSSSDSYVEIKNESTTVYLWAFKRRRNGWSGSGESMQGVTFIP